MPIEFKYRRERSSKGTFIFRPVAKVILKGENGRQVVEYMYIDSGADFTVIPYQLGLYLGLKTKREHIDEVQGLNGVVSVIYTKVNLTIGKESFPAKIAWAQIEQVPLLLGRTDIFDKFEITFIQSKQKILFEWTK
ncbi:hypothetical protein B9J78_06110 [bacterium Unc6]|nr:hypothetical protein [bacterium Unc6]